MEDAEHLYGVLGLEPGASREQVERAYRFSLELYGEDTLATYSLLDPTELEDMRSRIREAYQLLSDPERRQAYDQGHGFAPPEIPVVPFPETPEAGAEDVELPEVLTGPDLKRIREARGVSLRHMANVTKIGTRFLEYIEDDRFGFLPAPVYLRGFLHEYARMVSLDPRRVAEAYMKRLPSRS
ncbi:MAG: helix-turn-helix domain-containing protein [Acidobacteria bacterium]|jgi:curved DNA-binding protein CbpA|nr:helix-turn-helix domain-containing protein [Acidobacteriota bacterium]